MLHANGHPSFLQSCVDHRNFHFTHCNNPHSTVKFATSNGVYPAVQKIPPFPCLSTMKAKSYSTASDDFFRKNRDGLGLFLTREEKAFMNSQFCHVSSSTECAIALKPKESTTVTYHHVAPSICSRKTTALSLPSRTPVAHNCGLAGPCCGSTRRGLVSYCNDKLPLPANCNHEITNLCMRVSQHSTKAIFNEGASQYEETGKRCAAKDGSIEGCISPVRQTDKSMVTVYQASPNAMKGCGLHCSQEQTGMILREQCLSSRLPQKSTPILTSTCNGEEKRPRICSVDFNYSLTDSGTQGKQGIDMGNAASLSVKRKSVPVADRDHYTEQKRKRYYLGDNALEIMKDQASIEVSNPKDACKTPLSEPLPEDCLYSKDANLRIRRFSELSRSLEVLPSTSQVKAITSQTLTFTKNTLGTFPSSAHVNQSYGVRKSLEIGKSLDRTSAITSGNVALDITTSGALTFDTAITSTRNSKPGSNDTKSTNQPMIIDLTNETDNKGTNTVTSRAGDQDSDDAKSTERRKDIDEIINTIKPIQRDLLESDKASLKSGVAFDHDLMPRLIGVLPSAAANVISSLVTDK